MSFCGSSSDILNNICGELDDEYDECVENDSNFEEHDVTDSNITQNRKSPTFKIKPIVNGNECSICFDENLLIGLSCRHRFCKDCIISYLKFTIINNSAPSYRHLIPSLKHEDHALVLELSICSGITCPYINCCGIIGEEQIKLFVDDQTYKKFDRTVLLQTIYEMKDISPCPNGCGNFIQENCLCADLKCRKKQLAMRKRMQERSKQNDLKLQFWAKANPQAVKCCPTCFNHIEKNGGCDHMYCTRCKNNFLWSKALEFSFKPWLEDVQ